MEEDFKDGINAENAFLKMLSREITINDIIEKHGNGGYAATPNEIPQQNEQEINFTQQTLANYQRRGGYNQKELPFNTPTPPIVQQRPNWLHDLEDALDKYRKDSNESNKLDNIQRLFINHTKRDIDQKKEAFKQAFIQMISDKINFDENGNIVDADNNVIKSIGAFGLLFIRILNDVLDSKKTAEQHENDLKAILK